MKVKKDHFDVILEDLHSKIDGVVEAVVSTHQDVIQLKEDMSEVKSDIKVIKGVLSVNSADIAELKAKSHVH